MAVRIANPDIPKSVGKEAPLGDHISVEVDKDEKSVIILENIREASEVFKRAPVTGEVNLNQKMKDENGDINIRDLLKDNTLIAQLLSFEPDSDGYNTFAVDDANWIKDPANLAWKSQMMAELQASENALSNWLKDPSTIDTASMSNAEKMAFIERAVELAEQLENDALKEIKESTQNAIRQKTTSVEESKRVLSELIRKEKEGLKESDINILCKGV